MGGRAGGALDGSQGRGISVSLGGGPGASVVKGEAQRAGRHGEDDTLRKRPRESWRWVTFDLKGRKACAVVVGLYCCVWIV